MKKKMKKMAKAVKKNRKTVKILEELKAEFCRDRISNKKQIKALEMAIDILCRQTTELLRKDGSACHGGKHFHKTEEPDYYPQHYFDPNYRAGGRFIPDYDPTYEYDPTE